MDGDASTENNRHSGEYVVVARRYRPQAFGDLIGQGMVAQALKNAISTDRVGHAYLFTGARGVGKTSTARILAKALNCSSGPTTEPCGTCDICLQIASGDDVDVLEIDGASNRGIDEIRQLRSNVGIRPSRSRFKVYIIDEVHMLTKEAFNALLKTLEEPPEHVKFIFCTTEPGKIPITVLSRCQRFDFSPVDTDDIARRLKFIVESEGAKAEPEALELLARRAAGSMRDSQSLLEQLLSFVGNVVTVDDVHSMFGTAKADRVSALLQRLIARDSAGALGELQTTLQQGVDAGQLAEQLVTCLRDVMACAVGCDPHLLLFHSPSDAEQLKSYGAAWGIETLLAALQILDQTVTRMRQSMHGRILLEIALIRIANLEDLDLISQIAAQVSAGQPISIDRPASKKKLTEPTAKSSESQVEPAIEQTTAEQAPVLAASESPGDRIDATPPQSAGVQEVSAEQATVGLEADVPVGAEEDSSKIATTASKEPESPTSASSAAAEDNGEAEEGPETTAETSHAESPDSEDRSIDSPSAIESPQPIHDIEAVAPADSVETDAIADTAEIPHIELSPDTIGRVWTAALGSLGDMTADFAAHASSVAISAPNRLVVRFLGRYNTSKAYCERPEKRLAIEEAIQKVTGKQVRIEFSVTREDGPEKNPPAPAISPQQQMRQIASHPLVEMTVKLFDAQVLKIDPPKRRD